MTTPITPLPTPPSPADSPADFNTKAFALLGALPAFVTEANAQASGLDAAVASAGVEADAAALKAGEALTSANNAALSKTGADSARDAAVIAQNAAEAALDSFDDLYLGAKAVAPTTDNDGGALLPGALYWDTTLQAMRAWNGSAWVTLQAATAAAISNTPAGSIAATTVQSAIDELDAEKAPLSSPALTGTPTAPTAAPGTNTTQLATTEYARAAAIAFGGIKAYATKAEAAIASALLPDGSDIEVAQDESLSGSRTRYKAQGGALVFVANLDSARADLAASTGTTLIGHLGRTLAAAMMDMIPESLKIGAAAAYAAIAVNLVRTKIDCHAFEDWSTLNTTDTNLGYASFDAKATMTNSSMQNHFVGYQSRNIYNGAGAISAYFYGYDTAMSHTGTGTVAVAAGIRLRDVAGTGPITQNYGLYVDAMSRGTTANWGIYSAGNNNYFEGITTPLLLTAAKSSGINFGVDVAGKEIVYGYGTNGQTQFGAHKFYNGKAKVIAVINDGGVDVTGAVVSSGVNIPGRYTLALLPAAPEGATAFCTNGRKVGQGAGAGTGVPVYYSAGAWRVYTTDAVVTA